MQDKLGAMDIYLVGGAVRDKLLGLAIKERDWVVVGAKPSDLLDLNFKKVGKDFPIFLHPTTHEEYALARLERKVAAGYYGFVCDFSPTVTLEEDLRRRDLTINAIAEDALGNIIDPLGGQADLKNKVLRHVSISFKEDPVRILRIARFMARYKQLGFTIASETHSLIEEMVQAGELQALVPERVWQEIEKALHEPSPEAFFETLQETGALKELWPSLNTLWGIPQRAEYHPEIDTGIHTMMSLKMASKLSKESITRFAVVCHDLGKGQTPKDLLPRHLCHEERGVNIIEAFCTQYKLPTEFRNLAVITSRFHLQAHQAFTLKPATIVKLLEKVDAYRKPKRFEQFLIACEADARGRLHFEETPYPQREYLMAALNCTKSLSIAHILQLGLQGEALKQAIRAERIRAIKQLKANY